MAKLTAKRVSQILLRSRLPLERVQNLRRYRGGRQQTTAALLRLMVVAFACGKRTLRAAEALSGDVCSRMRRALGLRRVDRVSDTTLYDALYRTLPSQFPPVVVAQLKTELERKGIRNDAFPVGVMAYDGKKAAYGTGPRPSADCLGTCTATGEPAWMLKALRSCLVSCTARPVFGQTFLPNETGEATSFPERIKADALAFPRLFRIVTGDAGVTSKANCGLVRRYGKHYCFAVKGNIQGLYELATRAFTGVPVVASTTETVRGGVATRWLSRVSIIGQTDYEDACQLLSVRHVQRKADGSSTDETRYFVTSLPEDELSPDLLLKLVRLHWQIENGPNWTCDMALDEDLGSPCLQGVGPVLVSWLRILAYNLMAVFRAHLPKQDKKYTPWWRIKELVYQMLLFGSPDNAFLCAIA
jgi:hypothetical protein